MKQRAAVDRGYGARYRAMNTQVGTPHKLGSSRDHTIGSYGVMAEIEGGLGELRVDVSTPKLLSNHERLSRRRNSSNSGTPPYDSQHASPYIPASVPASGRPSTAMRPRSRAGSFTSDGDESVPSLVDSLMINSRRSSQTYDRSDTNRSRTASRDRAQHNRQKAQKCNLKLKYSLLSPETKVI